MVDPSLDKKSQTLFESPTNKYRQLKRTNSLGSSSSTATPLGLNILRKRRLKPLEDSKNKAAIAYNELFDHVQNVFRSTQNDKENTLTSAKKVITELKQHIQTEITQPTLKSEQALRQSQDTAVQPGPKEDYDEFDDIFGDEDNDFTATQALEQVMQQYDNPDKSKSPLDDGRKKERVSPTHDIFAISMFIQSPLQIREKLCEKMFYRFLVLEISVEYFMDIDNIQKPQKVS
jgi:hypothetical protein